MLVLANVHPRLGCVPLIEDNIGVATEVIGGEPNDDPAISVFKSIVKKPNGTLNVPCGSKDASANGNKERCKGRVAICSCKINERAGQRTLERCHGLEGMGSIARSLGTHRKTKDMLSSKEAKVQRASDDSNRGQSEIPKRRDVKGNLEEHTPFIPHNRIPFKQYE